MTVSLFVDSEHCGSRLKCHLCRDPGNAGQAFREVLAKVHEMPGPGLFDCPFGVAVREMPRSRPCPRCLQPGFTGRCTFCAHCEGCGG